MLLFVWWKLAPSRKSWHAGPTAWEKYSEPSVDSAEQNRINIFSYFIDKQWCVRCLCCRKSSTFCRNPTKIEDLLTFSQTISRKPRLSRILRQTCPLSYYFSWEKFWCVYWGPRSLTALSWCLNVKFQIEKNNAERRFLLKVILDTSTLFTWWVGWQEKLIFVNHAVLSWTTCSALRRGTCQSVHVDQAIFWHRFA